MKNLIKVINVSFWCVALWGISYCCSADDNPIHMLQPNGNPYEKYSDPNEIVVEHLAALEKKMNYIQLKEIGDIQKFAMRDMRRLDELERKVAGMQKQITILHSKKADKQ